ncbi:MAG: bifunctional metallophosphatase/5'-nucleotidase [Burkholderiales bacterium]|nr:bifunctional metallophosphatase/5'-nucleotidase [Burkholderiales bacterium]
MNVRRLLTPFVVALLAACAAPPPTAPPPPAPAAPIQVEVLAINDFHGNLKPPLGGIRIQDREHPGRLRAVAAGGAEHLATAIAQLRAKNPNHIVVAAGDLIGASPLLSALFHDEPTVRALNLMGLEVSAVGNHEFDKGAAELLRMQRGGCHPTQGCNPPQPVFPGAAWHYLAATTVVKATGQTLFPPYYIKKFQGVPVAFIGLTLKDTPLMVVPAGVEGLEFRDEVETVNALVPELKRQGVEAMVLLIHQGGTPTGDYNECPGIHGPTVDIAQRLDPAVAVIVSGHTHRAYNCRIAGHLVTSADKYGTVVTEIDLRLDPRTGRIIGDEATNVIVDDASFGKDPAQTALIAPYEQLAVAQARRVVGPIAGALSRETSPGGESPLGQVLADAQLEATRDAGARIAFMNPGGIRAAVARPADGLVRYEDLFAAQPFYNNLVTMTLSGTQLLQLLEQQWGGEGDHGRVLMVSRGFSYRWDATRPAGSHVVPGSAMLDGVAIDPAANYRVTVNAFMASGGDGFSVLRQGRERRTGMMDVDALELYVRRHPDLGPGLLDRIQRVN